RGNFMTTNCQEPGESRAGVSISEMARLVGLSRQRFHQLVQAGVFPQPQRDEASGRSYYDEPTQQQCLDVRRRNCGIGARPGSTSRARMLNSSISFESDSVKPSTAHLLAT